MRRKKYFLGFILLCSIALMGQTINLRVRNLNNTRYCDQFSIGSNAGIKMATCMLDLPSTGGVANGDGIQGAQTINSNMFSGITKPIDWTCAGATYTLSTNLTVPDNVTWHPGTGCMLTGSGTLTFNGKIDNPHDQQIFSTTLSLNLAGGNIPKPDWFGGKPDNSTDSAPALRAAIASFNGNPNPYGTDIGPSGGGWNTVKANCGIYRLLSDTVITKSGVHIQGSGNECTIFRYLPTADGTAIKFQSTDYPNLAASALHYNGLSDLTIDGTGSSSAFVKKALQLYDVAKFQLHNVSIRDFDTATTFNSVGIEIFGRELFDVKLVTVSANRPLVFGNNGDTNVIGLDVSTFSNLILSAERSLAAGAVPVTTQPVIDASAANVYFTNVKFDTMSLICGSYSFLWNSVVTEEVSHDVIFNNVRTECPTPIPEYNFLIAQTGATGTVSNFTMTNILAQNVVKGGYFFRNISSGSLSNSSFNGTASKAVIDRDNTVNVTLRDFNENVHSPGNHSAEGTSCGLRFGIDAVGSDVSTGQMFLRSCGNPQLILESVPGGTAKTITALSCSGNQMSITLSAAHVIQKDSTVSIINVVNSGGSANTLARGTFDVTSIATPSLTVTNPKCEAGIAYSSAGASSLTHGPQSYIGTTGGLGTFGGITVTPGDLNVRSDGSAINFGLLGNAGFQISAGGVLINGATPVGGANSVGIGYSVVNAGTANCPSTINTSVSATQAVGKCLVLTLGGTAYNFIGVTP